MNLKQSKILITCTLLAAMHTVPTMANESPEASPKIEDSKATVESVEKQSAAEKAAKELANPNTVYATMTFKFQYSGGFEEGGNNMTTLFQPSMPMPLANGDKVFFRPAIAYTANSGKNNKNDDGGFTDLSFDLAYSPSLSDPSKLLALGVFTTLPTGSNGFSGEQYAMGPELFYGKLSTNRVLGTLTTHQWGFGEKDGMTKTNKTGVQLMWVEIGKGGWTYGSVPQMSYDWANNQAEIPINLMVSKTTIIGQRPWKLGIEANYYVEKADHRPDFMLNFSVAPVVENKLATMLQ
ncbi:Neuromedin U [Vibrio crassostreae]|nr:Neuromedin U [Vibrio crassostreae]CAK3041080.1 Neuromedin U [Vibrio crassostreae]CAK3041405.1 Neuromedin U [Vibrio crassostreae]CAK3043648.1 Neuromedin U [Vibrio crassostreae]CAK3043762.1 Neuromedin U [Vibrio crassostreae]